MIVGFSGPVEDLLPLIDGLSNCDESVPHHQGLWREPLNSAAMSELYSVELLLRCPGSHGPFDAGSTGNRAGVHRVHCFITIENVFSKYQAGFAWN